MRTTRYCLLALIALMALAIPTARAQTPTSPGGIQREQLRTLEYYELLRRMRERPPEEGDLIDNQTKKPVAPSAPDSEARVLVNRVVTNPSEILAPADIDAVTSKISGREVTIKELFEMVAALNALYKARGCVTCQAFLPPQKVEAGTLEVRLVEGKLGAIRIEGAQYIRESFLLGRIRAKPGEVLDVSALEKDLAFINNTTDLRTAASLKPGATFGTVDAVINVREPQRFGLTVFGDNAGRDDIGRNRLGFIFNARSVFGVSDPLSFTGTVADGTLAGSFAYSVPVTRWGTRVGLQYDSSAIEIRSGPFAPLDVTGTASNAGVSLTQPVAVENDQRVNVFVGYNDRNSITEFGGTPITRADSRDLSLGFDAQRFTANGFWYTRQFLTHGTTNWGGDTEFFKYNADGVWTTGYRSGISTILRGSFQLSNDPRIPSFEQFFIGGMATVRGYPEGFLIGPRGYFVSGELQFPISWPGQSAASPPAGGRLRGAVFIDHGGVSTGGVNGQSFGLSQTLTSTGGGLIFNFSRYLSGRLMLGVPLQDQAASSRDWILHVYVQSILF